MRKFIASIALVAALPAMAAPAAQQRDPAYQAARDAGQVGEQPDGYLGIVGTPTPALRKLVNDINIQRKNRYTAEVPTGSTIEQFAFVTGCNLILRTAPGEKYRTPDGRWLTRGSEAPARDPRCS